MSEFLVRDGTFDEEMITRILLGEPSRLPGCTGTRKLANNINDLKAQVSANAKVASLVSELIAEDGLENIHFNMNAITDNAEAYVQDFLLRTYKETRGKPLFALDHIDDGTPIQLTITINPDTASAHLNWSGTGKQGYHSFNAPQAITRSATLYVIRCLINQDISLNEG